MPRSPRQRTPAFRPLARGRPHSRFVSRRCRVPDGDPTSSAHRTRRPREWAKCRGRLGNARRHFARSPATARRRGARPPRASRPTRGHARTPSLALREQKVSGRRRRPDIFCSPNAPPARAGEMPRSPRQRRPAFRPLAMRRPGGAAPGRYGPPVRPAGTPGRPRSHFVSRRCRVQTATRHLLLTERAARASGRNAAVASATHAGIPPARHATAWRRGARPPRASRPTRGHARPPRASRRFVSRRCRVPDGDPTPSAHQERAARASGRNGVVASATHAGIPPARHATARRRGARPPRASRPTRGHARTQAGEMAGLLRARTRAFRPLAQCTRRTRDEGEADAGSRRAARRLLLAR